MLHRLRLSYSKLLIRVLRWPKTSLSAVLLMMIVAFGALAAGAIRFDFFASDPLRLFYVNVEMPAGTTLEATMEQLLVLEDKVRAHTRDEEVRAIVSYAGQMFTEITPFFGDQYGQILVGLNPKTAGDDTLREVDDVIAAMRADLINTLGPRRVSFLRLAGGPPKSKPISVKVRGDDIDELRGAVTELKTILAASPVFRDIADDDSTGLMELQLRINQDAARRAGIDPLVIARTLSLLVDGEIVASLQDKGETVDVRVRALQVRFDSVDALFRHTLPLPLPAGGQIPLAELVNYVTAQGQGNIRHYNLRRAITLEADIDSTQTDTVQANAYVVAGWDKIRDRYPNVNLDFSGELDDIQESLDAIAALFLFGLGLIYVILGTQFRSYFQPLMILVTIPMAFTGVILGLIITSNPLSLFTLYGVVALAGIAVNSAIVLISAANTRLEAGMSLLHATIYAARRRVIPILITSLTTIAGLFSLAAGIAGHSLIWGPVATAIVWGLAFSTVLTLLMIPLLYRLSMRRSRRARFNAG
jgi:multidrug efflux pump subunit AcrB